MGLRSLNWVPHELYAEIFISDDSKSHYLSHFRLYLGVIK